MKVLFPLLFIFLLSGCAQKSYVALLDNPDGTTGSIVFSSDKGDFPVNQVNHGLSLSPEGPVAITVDQETLDEDFGPAIKARPQTPISFTLHFETGGSTLTADSQAKLPEIISTVRNYPMADISIIGHTDSTGKSADNERLGLIRAQAVQELLVNEGIQPLEITVTSHGEYNPVIPTPKNVPEPRNRRVVVTVR